MFRGDLPSSLFPFLLFIFITVQPSTSYETLCTLIDHLPEGESLSILGTNSPVEAFCAAAPSMQFLEVFVQLETQSSTVHQRYVIHVFIT